MGSKTTSPFSPMDFTLRRINRLDQNRSLNIIDEAPDAIQAELKNFKFPGSKSFEPDNHSEGDDPVAFNSGPDLIAGLENQKLVVENNKFQRYQLPDLNIMDMGRIDNSIDAMMMRMDDLRDIAMGRASYGESCDVDFLGSGWMQNSDCGQSKGYDGGETILKTTTDADGNTVYMISEDGGETWQCVSEDEFNRRQEDGDNDPNNALNSITAESEGRMRITKKTPKK